MSREFDSGVRARVARHGWVLGGAALALLALVAYFVAFTETSLGGAAVFVLLAGALPGALLGGVVQVVLRAGAAPGLPPRTINSGGWGDWTTKLAGHVAEFDRVAVGVEDGAVRQWLAQIGAELRAEVRQADSLVALGQQLEPSVTSSGPVDPQVRVVWDKLAEAEQDCARVVREAQRIRVELAQGGPDLTMVRSQLDVLRQELPRLRPAE